MDIPEPVVAAQAAADKAWADVEAYRKQVDAQRAKDAKEETPRGEMVTQPWTDDENRKFIEKWKAAVAAARARREVMAAEGVPSTWDTERAIRAAVRGE